MLEDIIFAFGAVDYYEPTNLLTPEIGRIKLMSWRWGYDSMGKPFNKAKEIPTRPCSSKELGVSDMTVNPESSFNRERRFFYSDKDMK